MYQRLDDADLPLLFTGSRQYKDLLNVSKERRDAPALLGEPATMEQVVNMTGQLTRLLNASQSYLRYKDKPIAEAKNETERRRMEAARAAEEYAQQKLKQLQLAGRTRELQMLTLEQCVLKEPQGEVDQSALNRASLQYMTKNVRKWTGALSAPDDEGNSIESLSCMAFGALGAMCQQQSLLDGDGELARHLIANMLTADLIWKERETSQPHPLEQALEKDPQGVVDSIVQDPLFDKLLGDLTPRKMYDFLVNDRVSEMGTRFMAKSWLTVPGLRRHGGEQASAIPGAHQSDRGSRISDAPSQRSRSQSVKH